MTAKEKSTSRSKKRAAIVKKTARRQKNAIPEAANKQASMMVEDHPQPSLISWESLKAHYFFLHSPIVLAILFYLFTTAMIAFVPATTYVTMYNMAGLYVFASTWINMMVPNWWVNTILFLISFFILLSSLSATYESLREPLSGGDLSSSLGLMLACIFLVPATGMVRLIFFSKS